MQTESALLLVDPVPRRQVGRETAVHRVYEGLKQRIIELTLPPGTVLSKTEITAEFGVSPTPVREALLRLEAYGLVEIFPQSRTVVSLIDLQDARETQFLRLSVEIEIARRLAPVITDEQVAQLRVAVERQVLELKVGDLAAFVEMDNRFHMTIYGMAGYGGLWAIVRARRGHLDRLRRLQLPTGGKAQSILADHGVIIDALAARDSAAAEAAVRRHLPGTAFAPDGVRAQFPAYFR